jgi:outer membrane protein insertion porin family
MRFENIRSLDFDETDPDSFVMQDGDILALQFGIDRDTRHPSTEPYQGELASILIEPSYSNISKIGGSVSTFDEILGPNYYARAILDYRKYWSKPVPPDTPITKARPVLAAKATYGHIVGDVPFFEQMFVGGLGSLRGYQNQRFWGKQSLVGTLEYRHPIQDNFSVIAFADYGGAWGGYPGISSFSQSSSLNFHLGYGLGISFRTPVGPIRIDFAFNEQGGSRTHFAFGSNF